MLYCTLLQRKCFINNRLTFSISIVNFLVVELYVQPRRTRLHTHAIKDVSTPYNPPPPFQRRMHAPDCIRNHYLCEEGKKGRQHIVLHTDALEVLCVSELANIGHGPRRFSLGLMHPTPAARIPHTNTYTICVSVSIIYTRCMLRSHINKHADVLLTWTFSSLSRMRMTRSIIRGS